MSLNGSNPEAPTSSETSTLGSVPALSRCTVLAFDGGDAFLSRAAALGICVGTSLEVLGNNGRGPILLLVHNSRIALGRGAADKVIVAINP
jgi:ferrous iron transport protein A